MTTDSDLKYQELKRRLPTVDQIHDHEIQTKTLRAIQYTPDYFWTAPAASSYKHHNPYCCNKHGLWIHTLMVGTAYERLVDSYLEQDIITQQEADYGRAAILLHDMRKYGEHYTDGEYANKDHDLEMAAWIRNNTSLPEAIPCIIETHMGAWYDGPAPRTDLEQLVHMADMTGSSKNITCGIYQKPQEITELYPGLPEAEL